MAKLDPIVLDRNPIRISYAYIFEARFNDLKKEDEFSCCLLIPKNDKETMRLLREGAKKALAKTFGEKIPKNLKHGIRDGDEYLEEGEERGEEYRGHYFVRASSTRPPRVLNARKEPAKPDEIVSGDYVFAILNPYAYEYRDPNTKAILNRGYNFGLQAIMFAKKGEPLGTILTEEQAKNLFANAEAQVDGFDDDDTDALFGKAEEDDEDLVG